VCMLLLLLLLPLLLLFVLLLLLCVLILPMLTLILLPMPVLREDPYLTATMGEAFTQQLQQPGPKPSRYTRTTSVTRHLVVYSGPEGAPNTNCPKCPPRADRFSFNANVTERDLEDYFYPPFEACINRERGNSKGAMCSDAAQNGVPSCASKLLMTTKPREWNATDDFFVVSDMGSYYNVYKQHKYRENTSDALLTDLQAGLYILYLRGGPKCNAGGDCPDGPSTTLQVKPSSAPLSFAPPLSVVQLTLGMNLILRPSAEQ
jgi:hypothetical protein